ncbi:hypothetical protein RB195_014313 [Necator americanus]|uniref:Uncharacterized protein n=1 Tax=Necator americanus TaxID=51031 RepID=A0ABR1DZH2_NECAM
MLLQKNSDSGYHPQCDNWSSNVRQHFHKEFFCFVGLLMLYYVTCYTLVCSLGVVVNFKYLRKYVCSCLI